MIDVHKKMEENGGSYWVNMANPEEAEFVLERMGGKTLLKEKYPRVYEAYCKTVEHARQEDGPDMNTKVSISHDFSYTPSENGVKIGGIITGFVCDPAVKMEDLGLVAARPWQNVSINFTLEDFDDPSVPPYASMTKCYQDINRFCEKVYNRAKIDTAVVNKTRFCVLTEFQGIDADGLLYTGFMSRMPIGDVDEICVVDRILLDDPKHKNNSLNNPIIMLYGRDVSSNQNYINADYYGGEYKNNNGSEQGDKDLRTLMPIKGSIVFHEGFEFKGLTEPNADKGLSMYRPVISLNGSKIVKYFQDKWTGDDPDYTMYETIKDCFTVDKDHKNICNFDLKINGSVNWMADLKGAGQYIKDNVRVLDYQVSAGFRLNVEGNKGTHIVALTVNYTDDPTVDLYANYNGDSVVYIPAVRVYWGCMAKDSLIRTPDGEKPVSEMTSGDKILTADGSCMTVAQILKAKEENIYRIRTDKGSIGLTGGHPVLLYGGEEKKAAELKQGDTLLMWNKEKARVSDVTQEHYGDEVYNLLIQESQEGAFLFANGFAVGDTAAQNRPLKAPKRIYTEEELKRQEEFEQLWQEKSF